MSFDTTLSRVIHLVFQGLGISCIGGAIFLQVLMFSNILYQGYFWAVEANPAILLIEITLTVFGVIYFLTSYRRLIHSMKLRTIEKKQ